MLQEYVEQKQGPTMKYNLNGITKLNGDRALPSKKMLNSSQTTKYLNDALAGKDVTMFKTVSVDLKEASKFIERQAKILRFVSISAGLPSITKLVEEIYYSAFEQSIFREMPDYKKFRDTLGASANKLI